MTEPLFTHNGHTVSLTPAFEFEISGEAFESDHNAVRKTAQEARDLIDSRVRALAAQNRHKVGMSLKAIAESGEECTIRGIHMNTKELLGVPKKEDAYGGGKSQSVYPPESWIKDVLTKKRLLMTEISAIDSKLRKYRTDEGATGYGRIEADQYDAIVERFRRRWTKLCEDAAAERPATLDDQLHIAVA